MTPMFCFNVCTSLSPEPSSETTLPGPNSNVLSIQQLLTNLFRGLQGLQSCREFSKIYNSSHLLCVLFPSFFCISRDQGHIFEVDQGKDRRGTYKIRCRESTLPCRALVTGICHRQIVGPRPCWSTVQFFEAFAMTGNSGASWIAGLTI